MRFIFKIKPYGKEFYGIWSTIVDSPVTVLMEREDIVEHLGRLGLSHLKIQKKMNEVEKNGCSHPKLTIKDLLSMNRAGENERTIPTEIGLFRLYKQQK